MTILAHLSPARVAGSLIALLMMAPIAAQAETEREYCERQTGAIRDVCLRGLESSAPAKAPPAAQAAAGSESDRAYCERQTGAIRDVCLRGLERAAAQPTAKAAPTGKPPAAEAKAGAGPAKATADVGAPYKVVDGFYVDAKTLKGFQTWRAGACDRCHGANQEGMVGPSLIASLQTLSKDEFFKVVSEGRLAKGMPSFATNKTVADNLDPLYSYLKGRSDGAITKAHVKAMK